MAEPREQPNGKWQGIAVHPSGRRATKVFRLKGHARAWAQELEATWRRDAHHDPRAGDRPVGEWLDRWLTARRVDPVTRDKEASHMRNHIRPKWDGRPAASVRRLDVQAWVKEMEAAGVGPHTIIASLRLFSTAMRDAADQGLITANPCERVSLPTPPPKPPFYWTPWQAELILAELRGPWRVAVDLDFHVGLRLGELLGLRVGAVDWERAQAHIAGVVTRHGWRAHPKSARSLRTVPIPGRILDGLVPLILGRREEEYVFPGAGGKPMSDTNFRNRIWNPAVAAAGLCGPHRPPAVLDPAAIARCDACEPVPVGTPHDMRHTAASWLVMDGVDLYRVQDILGHESFATTQRYSHLGPSAHERVKQAWARLGSGPQIFRADSAQIGGPDGVDDR